MREPPRDLSDDALVAGLHARYGLAVSDLAFLPIGHDSSAWVYSVSAGPDRYFLKVRARLGNEASLLVPRFLRDRGIERVVAPLPSDTGRLWARAGDYVLVLYPFVDGETGKDHGLSEEQWAEYGRLLHQVHAAVPGPDLEQVMRRESFTPEAEAVRRLGAHISDRRYPDANTDAMALSWQERREDIRALVERAEGLSQRLARRGLPLVLCHADIHTANILVDRAANLWIVDWDETVLAPRERDLMFVVGGISRDLVGPREEEIFFRGYGPAVVDPLALAYYRYAWAVSDIAAYGEQPFFRPDLGAESKAEAVERFRSLFAPGAIVSIALGSPHDFP